jgi:hypothetical protein
MTYLDSIAKHVQAIETEGKFYSDFKIVATTKEQVCFHMLVSVTANDQECSMKGINISSIVYSVMGSTAKYLNPTYAKKDCLVFGNLFLLLMVYPSFWFPRLMGTPSIMESPTLTKNGHGVLSQEA